MAELKPCPFKALVANWSEMASDYGPTGLEPAVRTALRCCVIQLEAASRANSDRLAELEQENARLKDVVVAENGKLATELHETKTALEASKRIASEWLEKAQDLSKVVERLREGLVFYADVDSWDTDEESGLSRIEFDQGQRARALLDELRKERT
jgi:hypothetical protein